MEDFKNWTSPKPRKESLMTPEQFGIALLLTGVLLAASALSGITTNLLNISVFLRMRLRDSVTLSFFALSLSDLCITVFLLLSAVSVILSFLDMKSVLSLVVDPNGLGEMISRVTESFFMMSTLFTCYLAITRSMCVILPFRFKQYFTTSRTAVTLCFISCLCLTHLAIFTEIEMKWKIHSNNNTRISLVYRDTYAMALFISDCFKGPIVTVCSEIVVTLCVTYMAYKLKQSLIFRQRQQVGAEKVEPRQNNETNSPREQTYPTITLTNQIPNEKAQTGSAGVAVREMKVIKQVTLVASVFVFFKLPTVALVLLRYTNEDFKVMKQYRRLAFILAGGRFVFEALNATINICVYYNYNTKYRLTLRQLLGLDILEEPAIPSRHERQGQ